jgi:hypothetical protein
LSKSWSGRWPIDALHAPSAPLLILVPVGVLEMAVNRVAVPMLRPMRGAPPAWHTALDYGGLFLFYFASLLGVIAAGLRVWQAMAAPPEARRAELAQAAPLGALALVSAWAILVAPGEGVTFAMEVCLAAAVAVAVGRGAGILFGRPLDLGVVISALLLAAPLALHFFAVVGARWLWPDGSYDGAGAAMATAGTLALAVAGLASPYCLAPRPFVRAVTRLLPILTAIGVAVAAALLLRKDYLAVAQAIKLAIGVELSTTSADPQLTIYLLAIATLSWTLASCTIAQTAPRRMVAVGLGLLVLGGYAFQWPLHYLLLALGLTSVADTAAPVRQAEAPHPGVGPVIDDATWGRYLGAVSAILRRRCTSLHSLTTRSAHGGTSSVLVGEADGRSIRARIDRDGGAVIGLDIAIGRDVEMSRGATLTVVSDEAYLVDDAPPAGAAIESGDAAFDQRFRSHGSPAQLAALFDAGTRALALTLLDGWLALAHGQCLRYRSYPGRGEVSDPLIPLADLAQGQVPGGAGERVMVVLALLLELAARGEVVTSAAGILEGEPAPGTEPQKDEAQGDEP